MPHLILSLRFNLLAMSAATKAWPNDRLRWTYFEIPSRLGVGITFGVKLWPTLVFLEDGREVARLVRPTDVEELRKALVAIDRV